MVFIVPAASRGLAGPSDPIASLCREAQCRQRPERQRGRSSVLHRRKGDEEGRLTFLQRDVRQLAGGSFFFRRRKKNQERRHPFEWVDDDLGALPPRPPHLGALPPRPPPTIDGRPSHSRLLPALPCRPGETFLVAAVKLYIFFAGDGPIDFIFSAAERPAPPARRVGRVEASRSCT